MHDARKDAAHERPDAGQALVAAENSAVGPIRRDPYASIALEAPEGDGDDLAVTLRQYLHMVLKRKWLILSISLAFVVLGGVRTLLKTPLYSATARIQIDREAVKV